MLQTQDFRFWVAELYKYHLIPYPQYYQSPSNCSSIRVHNLINLVIKNIIIVHFGGKNFNEIIFFSFLEEANSMKSSLNGTQWIMIIIIPWREDLLWIFPIVWCSRNATYNWRPDRKINYYSVSCLVFLASSLHARLYDYLIVSETGDGDGETKVVIIRRLPPHC